MDDEEWMTLEPPPVPCATKTYVRRNKMVKLDDLVLANDREKRELENKRLKAKQMEELESSDDEADAGTDQLTELISKCSAQVGSDHDLKDAPMWGEKIFGPQRAMQPVSFNGLELKSLKALTAAAGSVAGSSAGSENDEDALVEQLLVGRWGSILLRLGGCDEPGFLSCLFNKMTCSGSDVNVQRAAADVLCDYFTENASPAWKPALPDILEVFHSYGYQDQPVEAANEPSTTSPVPVNFGSLLQLLLAIVKHRHLNSPDDEELLVVLARCLLDRGLFQYHTMIQDCVAELVNDLSPSSINKTASSLASVSTKLVCVYHVLISLRGKQEQVVPLRKEAAFQVMSNLSQTKLSRLPTDVIEALEEYDPKSKNVDFVQLYYHLNLVDIWLKAEPNFASDEEASNYWNQVLRTFAMKISIGDYRTCAHEVRNRASFIMTTYP